MDLKYLDGPKNNKRKAFISNLLKSGVCCKAKATESGPRRKWKVSNEAELVAEEAGQARGLGKEGQEPPNTSKTQTREAGGELGWEPHLLPQLCLAGSTARWKGHRGETPMTYGINFHPLPLPRLLPLSPCLGTLTSPLLCRSGLK